MNQAYIGRFDVRLQDLDARGGLRTRALLQALEQTAVDTAAAAGWGLPWSAAQGTTWTSRQVHLQRLVGAYYHDMLTVAAWISAVQRVSLVLDYEVRRPDGTPLAVGRTDRVYIDRESRQPRPLDPAILANWPRQGASTLWAGRLVPLLATSSAEERVPHTVVHTIYGYDADTTGVTDHAIYADWLEDAAGEALREWGYAPQRPADPVSGHGLALHYLALQCLLPTRPGDTVIITTRLLRADPQGVVLTQDIRHGGYPVTMWAPRPADPEALPGALVQAESVYQDHTAAG